jgi:DUF1680 family protein
MSLRPFIDSLTLAAVIAVCGLATGAEPEVKFVEKVVANGSSAPLYVGNRAPLMPGPFVKLPIGSITPKGWLRQQLQLEADGMTGHLEEISRWCKFDGSAWVSADGLGENGWEELPYWLKGYGDLGYVLKDENIIREARRWIDAMLSSQEPDGYFGPRANKTSLDKKPGVDGNPDLWPHMVMLNVLQSFYEATGDERVLPFMAKYFQWLNKQPPETFGRGYWPRIRFGDTIESAYWLYDRTGDASLLELTKKIHERMQDWTTGVHDRHNVNIAQAFREPTIYSQQVAAEKLQQGAERNYRQVMDIYGQFPGGGFAGDENYRAGFTDPHQGFETCGMVEFMHSFEMLTKITGNPAWSDRTEDIAFNSLPAAITPDWKGLHYLTCANQVQLDRANHSPGIQNRGTMFSYSPGEVYRCCQHNVSHGWPYYAEELWLATADRGLCASLYAASEVSAKVGGSGDGKDAATVKIVEETDYPFGEVVSLHISLAKPTKFPLYLRIPQWCETARVELNGKQLEVSAKSSSFVIVNRQWNDGDTVKLQLPMQVAVKKWEKNHNAISVSDGPLSFSLKIGEKWSRSGGTDAWPDYEVFPSTSWNYGLELNEPNPASSFEVVRRPLSPSANPFTQDGTPIELVATAKKIDAWQLDAHGLAAKLQDSPVKSDEPAEKVTLIPMGAARLRISMFPVIGSNNDANEWKPPEPAVSKK